MKIKIERISEKLIEIGYKKQEYNKSKEIEFNADNEIDFICKLTNIVGDSNKAKELSDSYSKMLLNDFIPEISFESDKFELEFFINKNLIKIVTLSEARKIGKCGLEIQEVLPFKEISINDFYNLFIDKDYNMSMILCGGSN